MVGAAARCRPRPHEKLALDNRVQIALMVQDAQRR
jgi:hypothetical protein